MPEIRHSVCALDCPDCCSLLVTVEDGRATKLRGNPDHPVTRGFLCGKVAQYLEREYSPGPPALSAAPRRAPRAKAASSASPGTRRSTPSPRGCSAIAAEFGPEAILPYSYAGTMGLLNGGGMDRRFFHRLGASRLDRTICSTAGTARADRGARRPLRHRARAVPPLQADPRLGRQHSRHQRPPVALHHGGAAQRREAVHHRPAPQPHRRGRRQALLHQPGQRHGAGARA